MTLTREMIERGSHAFGYTRDQMIVLGVGWPAPRGWKYRVIGKTISERDYARFLAAKKHRASAPAPGQASLFQ